MTKERIKFLLSCYSDQDELADQILSELKMDIDHSIMHREHEILSKLDKIFLTKEGQSEN